MKPKASGMIFFNRRTSLSTDFLLFSLLSFIAVIALSIGFWIEVYHKDLQKKREQLSQEAARIDSTLTDSMDYITQYAAFIGEKIVQRKNPYDTAYIASLINDQLGARAQEHNFYYTTTIDWVTPDKILRVSNKIGVLPKPFDMRDRDYLKRTPLHPWTLQLSPPRIGGLSGQWILPAGVGITDERGRFLGSITLGFSLQGLAQRIAQNVNTDTHYLVLTDNSQLVLDSTAGGTAEPNPQFLLHHFDTAQPIKKPQGYLDAPVAYRGVDFSYYRKLDKYPYVILTGYDAGMAASLFNDIVLSRSIGLLLVALASLGMLYIMRRRLVRPVTELAQAADSIRRGQQIDIPETHIREIDILGGELKKISEYVQNERAIYKELNAQKELLEHKTAQLQTATTEALAARDAAVKADMSKTEFLTNMSHELRTPMNAIVGLTELLASQKVSPARQKEFFNTLRLSTQQLLGLINALLDLSKIENKRVELERITFNFKEILQDIVNINDVKAAEKNILLTMSYTGADEQVIGDPLRIKQILINLISNAIKFTAKGYVSVEATCQAAANGENAFFRIDIRDTGIGIKPEQIKNIFDKFTQADSSTTRKYGGTGLGLAISKNLVEMLGGEISVTSTYGAGSCFTVTLPLPLAQRHAKPAHPVSIPTQETSANIKGAHILLVEDYRANILVATALLEDFGCTYRVAQNGRDALDALQKEEFAMVLMDVQMPLMDGFDTTRLIRLWEKQGGRRHVPVIGMTAHALAGDRERCLAAGMDDYIAKPFKPSELHDTIARHFVGKRLHAVEQ